MVVESGIAYNLAHRRLNRLRYPWARMCARAHTHTHTHTQHTYSSFAIYMFDTSGTIHSFFIVML